MILYVYASKISGRLFVSKINFGLHYNYMKITSYYIWCNTVIVNKYKNNLNIAIHQIQDVMF